MTERKKKILQLWLDPGLYRMLREVSEASLVPMSAIVRDVLPDAIESWCSERGMAVAAADYAGEDGDR